MQKIYYNFSIIFFYLCPSESSSPPFPSSSSPSVLPALCSWPLYPSVCCRTRETKKCHTTQYGQQFKGSHNLQLNLQLSDLRHLNSCFGVYQHHSEYIKRLSITAQSKTDLSKEMLAALTLRSSSWTSCLARISASKADCSSRRADMSNFWLRRTFHKGSCKGKEKQFIN